MPVLRLDSMVEDVVVQGVRRRLRQGFSTGTTASAAAKAALWALRTDAVPAEVEVPLPAGRRAVLAVVRVEQVSGGVRAIVTKNGGDDPDATHGAEIIATVRPKPDGLLILGGEGVGRVTRPGLALAVGEAAINPVPRRMLRAAVAEALLGAGRQMLGAVVEISVTDGEHIAQSTWNPRVGIEGGISILGSTGIVRPYSLAAWRASVIQALRVAAAGDADMVVLCPGAMSHQAAQAIFSDLPGWAFVEIGGFLGEALQTVARDGRIRRVAVVGMMGKLSKLAAGQMGLSARDSSVDLDALASLAAEAGLPAPTVAAIRQAPTARAAADLALAVGADRFFHALLRRADAVVASQIGRPVRVQTVLLSPEGAVWARSGTGPGA
ncbi:MAG: cobalt-precorrin-5B (C(1))-methyltransferase [Thermaerobacter sp.]|nr:cobalt-precorrin-5B (C(1))-methyltransferase [Thermaerobacter sp.]